MKHEFARLISLAQKESQGHTNPENLAKELLHYEILKALSGTDISKEVVLQGGAALRLFYGGHRYSEDLDFVIGTAPDRQFVIDEVIDVLTAQVMDRYGLDLEVKHPKNEFGDDVGIKRWSFKVDIPGFLRKQEVKIEFCNVPSHEHSAKLLMPNYSFQNDSCAVMLKVESEREIMADKMLAIASRPYLKNRDLWDLKYLADRNIKVDMPLVMRKINDYRSGDILSRLAVAQDRLNDDKASENLMIEMERFLSSGALRGLYLTDPPGIDLIKFAIEKLGQMERYIRSYEPDASPSP